VTVADFTRPQTVADAIRKETRLFYFETPANPNLRVIDIAEVASLARSADVLTVVDSTFATWKRRQAESRRNFAQNAMSVSIGFVSSSFIERPHWKIFDGRTPTGAIISLFSSGCLTLLMDYHCLTLAWSMWAEPRI
jgi:hypothetical protein